MTQDGELVGIGISFIIAAAVVFLAVNGNIEPNVLRVDWLRFQATAMSSFNSFAVHLPR